MEGQQAIDLKRFGAVALGDYSRNIAEQQASHV